MNPRALLFVPLALLTTLQATPQAGQSSQTAPVTAHALTAHTLRDRLPGVAFDRPGDGALWASGHTYKAQFTGRRFRYVGGDISLAMIGEARRSSDSGLLLGFVNTDAGRLPFADRAVDCVIVWRLLHHVREQEVRTGILREAARVSRRQVLLSFHHPFSFTHWRKTLKRKLLGGTRHGSAITQWQLEREAAACGLRVVETRGFQKYVSINWFACLEKTS